MQAFFRLSNEILDCGLTPNELKVAVCLYSCVFRNHLKAKEAMSLLGVKRTTFYKYVRIYEQEQKDDMPKG